MFVAKDWYLDYTESSQNSVRKSSPHQEMCNEIDSHSKEEER